MKQKFLILSNDGLLWVADTLHIDRTTIREWIVKSEKSIDGMLILEGLMETQVVVSNVLAETKSPLF